MSSLQNSIQEPSVPFSETTMDGFVPEEQREAVTFIKLGFRAEGVAEKITGYLDDIDLRTWADLREFATRMLGKPFAEQQQLLTPMMQELSIPKL